LILDEARSVGRRDLARCWEPLGVRPDQAAWSKAIANGHALDAASIFVTGSF